MRAHRRTVRTRKEPNVWQDSRKIIGDVHFHRERPGQTASQTEKHLRLWNPPPFVVYEFTLRIVTVITHVSREYNT
jgi:hypothetical protein